MGNALGLGLVSVVFFGEIGDRLTPAQVGPAFVHAFQHALGWVAAVMLVIFLLMFALPKRPAQHVEGGPAQHAEGGAAERPEKGAGSGASNHAQPADGAQPVGAAR